MMHVSLMQRSPKGIRTKVMQKHFFQACSNPVLLSLLHDGLNPSLGETLLFWILNERNLMSKWFQVDCNSTKRLKEASFTCCPVQVVMCARAILMGTMSQRLGDYLSYLWA